MTRIFFFLILIFAGGLAFADNLIKECSVSPPLIEDINDVDHISIRVFSEDGKTFAKVVQDVGSRRTKYQVPVEVTEGIIYEGFNVHSDPREMTNAESLIAHAIFETTSPETQGLLSAGFDLTKAHYIKMYLIGRRGPTGSKTIVEARDATGKLLGSFLGGFLVSPCQ